MSELSTPAGALRVDAPGVVRFLGCRFTPLDLEAATKALLRADGRAPFRYVVTPNVQHVVAWIEDREKLGPFYEDAWLSLADGRLLPLLARPFGLNLPSASGSDLTARLLPALDAQGSVISVIGPGPEDIAALRTRFPGLTIHGHCPPFGFIEREADLRACLDFVAAHPAPFIFLAVGTPRQEILARHLFADARATGMGLCVGASIDFLVGRQTRAPRWMQDLYLEWLHRLLGDPRRLARRYLIDSPRIFLHMARFALGARR